MGILQNQKFTMSEIRLGLVGAGYIANEHLNVIKEIKDVQIAGITSRTVSKATDLAKKFKLGNVVFPSIDNMIDDCTLDGIMVLVSANQIFDVLIKLIPKGIPLFIEKPPGLNPFETKTLADLAANHETKNLVGFNRRYYSIFHEGIKIINDNGSLLGVNIEGHERFWSIKGANLSDDLIENWLYANSTHTIDLLRFFGGETTSINAYSRALHEKNGDQFVASMEFESGVLGTYISHWHSPGGWSVTLYGEGVTVIFRPLEEGVWFDTNFNRNIIHANNEDKKYKPGFFAQLNSFCELIRNGNLDWPSQDLSQACKTMELAKVIANA